MKRREMCFALLFFLLLSLFGCGTSSKPSTSMVSDVSVDTTSTEESDLTTTEETLAEQDDPIEVTTDNTEKTEKEIQYEYDFIPLGKFLNGLVWVSYTNEFGAKKYGLINEQGVIIYVARENVTQVFPFDTDNFAYYTTEECDVIVDKQGLEHLITQKSEEESICICGHGGGVFILRRDVKNFSQNAVYIRIVNAEGTALYEDQEIENDIDTDYTYFGEGIFRSYIHKDSKSKSGGFVNAKTGAIYRECFSGDVFLTSFENQEAFFQTKHYIETKVTPEVFESESSYNAWFNSITIEDGQTIIKPNLVYPEGIKILVYGSFDEGLSPVVLRGIDNREYFTIVNENGTQLYEPFKLPKRTSIIDYTLYERAIERNSVWRYNTDLFYSQGKLIYLEDTNVYYVDVDGSKERINIDFNEIERFDGAYIYLRNGIYDIDTSHFIDKILLLSEGQSPLTTDEFLLDTKTYVTPESFSIEGKWKNIGDYSFGQVQGNAIIVFDGTHCNIVSPQDVYAFYKDGDNYKLDCTSLLSTTMSFTVRIIDNDHIDIYTEYGCLELTRVS